jgi:hypothetical protein
MTETETEQLVPATVLASAKVAGAGATLEAAHAFQVADAVSYQNAGELMRAIKAGINEIKIALAPAKDQAFAAHKAIVKLEKDALRPREQAQAIYSQKRLGWQQEEDRKRRLEEDRLRAEELKRAEDARIAEAERLEAEGRIKQAEAVIAAPIAPAPIVLPTTVPKSDGVSVRETWTMRIVNASLVPRELCIPDEKALNAMARTRRQAAVGTVPGVEFYAVKSEATKAY